MPPAGENLTTDQYLGVTAFILQTSDGIAGAQALTPTTAVPIGTAASGAAPSATTAPVATTATDPAAGRGGQPSPGPGSGGQAGARRGGPAIGRGGAAANAGPPGVTAQG